MRDPFRKGELIVEKIREGDRFRSPFTKKIMQVRKIYMNSAVLEEVGNPDHEVITEMGAIRSLYERVEGHPHDSAVRRAENHEN